MYLLYIFSKHFGLIIIILKSFILTVFYSFVKCFEKIFLFKNDFPFLDIFMTVLIL